MKRLRLLKGATQIDYAAKAGISVGLLREIEAGRAVPSPRVARLLEAAFGRPADQLLKIVQARAHK